MLSIGQLRFEPVYLFFQSLGVLLHFLFGVLELQFDPIQFDTEAVVIFPQLRRLDEFAFELQLEPRDFFPVLLDFYPVDFVPAFQFVVEGIQLELGRRNFFFPGLQQLEVVPLLFFQIVVLLVKGVVHSFQFFDFVLPLLQLAFQFDIPGLGLLQLVVGLPKDLLVVFELFLVLLGQFCDICFFGGDGSVQLLLEVKFVFVQQLVLSAQLLVLVLDRL